MERQPIKLLFSYFGQARMVEECIPWHDDLIRYLNSNNIQVDLEYHLWDEYYNKICIPEEIVLKYNDKLNGMDDESQLLYTLNRTKKETNEYAPYTGDVDNFKKINSVNLEKVILTNRIENCNIKCNFYSYEIMENLYEIFNVEMPRNLFFNTYSQFVSKGLSFKNLSNEYDIVFSLRTDLIFDPNSYDMILNFLNKYYKKIQNNKIEQKNQNKWTKLQERTLYVSWLHYDYKLGLISDDTRLFGDPETLKTFFNNYEKKIYSYIKNMNNMIDVNKIHHNLGHHIALNFTFFYNMETTDKVNDNIEINVKSMVPDKVKCTIARESEEVKELLKTVNYDTFKKVDEIKKNNHWLTYYGQY